ncbi:histidine kinase [Lentimonas sp. CC11]|uniref:histidine kinase n=2 Tax=unclassified Lentimonas TaxID=2630993 RepID=UPI00138A5381|nr:histidine kinase [Lentimonas sp. CC11]
MSASPYPSTAWACHRYNRWMHFNVLGLILIRSVFGWTQSASYQTFTQPRFPYSFVCMIRPLLCFALLLCCSVLEAALGGSAISELEARKEVIEQELTRLSRPSLRGGVGAIGYHTAAFSHADNDFWVEIDLKGEHSINEIVLVPVLWRDMEEGFQADAFPEAFRVLAGTAEDREGQVVAEFQQEEGQIIGITPLVIPFPETVASWVRIEVTRMSRRIHDGKYVFQLSEIMVFGEGQNIALRKPISAVFPKPRDPSGAWDERFLVDGATPYIMNSARGQPSLAYLGDFGAAPTLLIDLGESYPISEIRLHAVEQSNTVPQAFVGDLGIPKHFKVEGANSPDFEDAVVLVEHQSANLSGMGPIMMWSFPEMSCRYVRIVTLEQGLSFGISERLSRIGFAEIELMSAGENVAQGKRAWTEPAMRSHRDAMSLTDGRNLYGEILPIQAWLKELAKRRDLEAEWVGLSKELSRRYALQKQMLIWLGRISGVLLFAIVVVALYGRMQRIRNETKVRERIAANLHDELGANLHAIGMWSDIAQESVNSPEPLIESLKRIRGLTERTGASARFCSNMLEAKGVCEVLVDDMKREASRLLADISFEISFENEAQLNRVIRRKRIDIFLFFKESLANIIRHGQASTATIHMSANDKEVALAIADDGCGFSGGLPNSLKRRAKLMRAEAGVDHPKEGGTRIWLKLKVKRKTFIKE